MTNDPIGASSGLRERLGRRAVLLVVVLVAGVMAILARLNQEQGRTIVVVSHDPSITDFTSRCIHLLDGRITNSNVK